MNAETSPVRHSRREFLATSALATAAALTWTASRSPAAEPSPPRWPIIGFTKPFQQFSAQETADFVASVGWDGVECPVRAKGQIEPARVADELPGFTETLRRQKLEVHLVATDITSLQTPHAETVLRTMAKLGLKRFRLGFFFYRPDEPPEQRLREIAPALKDVAEACRDLGLQAGFQNHSGARSVGAPIWDVFQMIRDLDPRHMGFCFDIGHATVEGGLSWPVEAKLAEPFYTAVLVKDFVWQRDKNGWKDAWCPLGEGMVRRAYFEWLRGRSYRGPICQHHEYELGDRQQMLTHMRRDLEVLRQWLS